MRKVIGVFLVLTIPIILSACSAPEGDSQKSSSASAVPSSSVETPSPTPPAEPSSAKASPTPSVARTQVIWADYTPGLQAELDAMTTSQDCIGIQSFYGMTAATEESMKASTGHGNEALNAYIDESLKLAQCG